MWLSGDHGRLIKWHQPDNLKFVKQLIKESGEESIPKRKIILQNKREDLVRSDKILQ